MKKAETARPMLFFGTANAGKEREIRVLLADLPLRLLFLGEMEEVPEIEETGSTFEENARLKAEGYAPLAPGAFVAAEDSGLVVPALGGEPGVYSARYGGLADDKARNALLLHRMKRLENHDRAAYYEAVVALREPGGEIFLFEGRVHGFIAEKPTGTGGFGYDPVFFHGPSGTTFGCVTREWKGRFSHRGKAILAMKEHLSSRLGRLRSMDRDQGAGSADG